ncbi:class I SAM-dependent methyltransferase [Helicobacter aurati]|uniref:Class I SAM-dependent methyltransferase n=1 Tax=Helicobacter aurati TaxID=137778 RepID=A0A3D8J4U3_9HELI|nr:class I SAM-dependent methyltransferase [Helicobacter aurati]RDU72517.1 class I SAM-dependent methyltransferase [Helicobacter aurati]
MKEAILEPMLRTMRLKKILPSVREFANPKVLDIGCGWEARLLQEIEPFITHGVGIDLKAPTIHTDKLHVFSHFFESKEGIDSFNASKASSCNNKKCDLPFDNESFEIATLLAVLEHLHHPLEMLKEIHRILKPKGILLLTVPSRLAKPLLEFLAYKLHIVSEAEIRDHKQYYNKTDIYKLISMVQGLTIVKHQYFQFGMNNFCKIVKQ